MSTDYYAVLGVAREATDDELRRAYRRRARQLHPDLAPHADPQDFHRLREAFEVLTDPAARARVDGGEPAHPMPAPRPHPGTDPATQSEVDAVVHGLGLQVFVALGNLLIIVLGFAASCGPSSSTAPSSSYHQAPAGVGISSDASFAWRPCSVTGLGPAVPNYQGSLNGASCSYPAVPYAPGYIVSVSIVSAPMRTTPDSPKTGRHRAIVGATSGEIYQSAHTSIVVRVTPPSTAVTATPPRAALASPRTGVVTYTAIGHVEAGMPNPS